MSIHVFVDIPEGWDPQDLQGGAGLLRGRDWSTQDRTDVPHRVLPLHIEGIEDFVELCRATGQTPWVEVGEVGRLQSAARAGAHLWLRGLESGGPCGEVGAIVLVRAAHRSGAPWVAQGLGLRGMGAALAVGAAGIVLDAALWALPGSPLHPRHKLALTQFSARDTRRVDGVRSIGGPVTPSWCSDPDSGIPCPMSIGALPSSTSLTDAVSELTQAALGRSERARQAQVLGADPLGTGLPLVQGPMANISEHPDLAHEVLLAGGLPFCALGALRPEAAEEVLEGMAEISGRWGAGIIGFDVMPWRDEHIEAVVGSGSRPVILAGGSPALAMALRSRGLEPWLHTPSARLAAMALRRGVPAVIFEGREAGGHVGMLPSSALWEEGLAAAEDAKSPALVVLAGGIGDSVSAAFAAAMATDCFESGHRIALQIGTALFFTHEIVESGQITVAYQQSALAATRTVYVGDTVGLPLQCTPNPYTDRAQLEEAHRLAEGLPLAERRRAVEEHNLGRTRIAAKGIERDGEGGYRALSAQRQIDEGAFTLGQGALVEDQLTTIPELFSALTTGASALLQGRRPDPTGLFGTVARVRGHVPQTALYAPHRRVEPGEPGEPIAVVGVGCVLPGGRGVEKFWRSLLYGMDAVRAIPASRWRADRYFDPSDSTPTRTGTRMAGQVTELGFDPVDFGIPPRVVPSMDRAQQLALIAAREAMAGVRVIDRRRAAVVFGNSMGGEHNKSLAVRVRFREVLAALSAEGLLSELDEAEFEALSERIDRRLGETLPPVDVESMSGLLSNVIAGRVASWLGFMGGNSTVDAACAASLAAIDTAVSWLRNRRCDLVLTGGIDADLSPETFVGFSRTHALSGTGSTPFSTHADGFVMAEGAAVFALKRLSDAEHAGDRVWALIRGIGQSSDGRSTGITAPRAEGQVLAIQRAYADCDFGPEAVELVEAHGTGTAVGDLTEIRALSRIFAGQQAWLGAVKSNIGHCKGAAGAAGLLKAVLAVNSRTIPPTIHATPLREELARGPFRLPRTPRPFTSKPARAGVSAFGFGGTNFHVLVEQPPVSNQRLPSPHLRPTEWADAVPELRVYAADTAESLLQRFVAEHTVTPEEAIARPHRLVVLGSRDGLRSWVSSGRDGCFGTRAWRYSGELPDAVLVFPGQGSTRDQALDPIHSLVRGSEALADLGITELDTSADPAAQHELMVTAAIGWSAAIQLPIAGVIGHSVGELGALAAAGVLTPADAIRLARARGRGLAECPPGGMIAVALGEAAARDFAADVGLDVAALNSPDSSVLAGPLDAVQAALNTARQRGVRATILDVERAFHTEAVRPAADALAQALADTPLHPGRPWWPNVSDAQDPTLALIRAVTEPVGFQSAIEAAASAGHRLFVHSGPGSSLARHIELSVPGAAVVCLDPNPGDDGIGLVWAAAELLARGHAALLRQVPARFVTLPFPTEPRAPQRTAAEPIRSAASLTNPSPDLPGSDLRSVVVACIVEVTGYPPEALVRGARLDHELGIDSIRKMEIVGLVQERLDLDFDDASLGGLGSLDVDGLVDWFEGHGTSPRPAASPLPGRWRLLDLPIPSAAPTEQPIPAHLRLADEPLTALLTPFLQGEALPSRLVLNADCPAHHGVAAFLAVASIEANTSLRTVCVRGQVDDDYLSAALAPSDGRVLIEGSRTWAPGYAEPRVHNELPKEPVFLASGGTTGILAHCLAAVPGSRGIIFGRRRDQQAPDGFEYLAIDVTAPDAVRAVAARCRESFGRIDIVVHAAGVLRDGPLSTRSLDDLDEALAAKLIGARNLIDATLDDAPIWVPFSSVSAHIANPGQSLYAAANATLEKLVHPSASRSIPLVWTAWSGVGMARAPALQRLLAARGVTSLRPEDGGRSFVEALTGSGPQWLSPTPPPRQPLPWPITGWDGPDSPNRFSIRLDPEAAELDHHRVAGRALVPAAMWVSAILRAAELLLPGPAWQLDDFSICGPCFVHSPRSVSLIIEGVNAHIRRGDDLLCSARLRSVDSSEKRPRPGPITGTTATSMYREDLLFHGPAWQMLTEVSAFEPTGASADITINGADPLATVVDAAHQLLAAWSGHTTGWLGLPVGAASWTMYEVPSPGTLRLEICVTVEGRDILGEVVASDLEGRVVIAGSSVRLHPATPWRADA